MNEQKIAKILLDGIWDQNQKKVETALKKGANPDWIINGYPLLLHAVFTRNEEIVNMLLDAGASTVDSALGFALDRGIGNMVVTLAYRGAIPKEYESTPIFGPFPKRYSRILCS